MSETEVGRVVCDDCEGEGWATQLHAPDGARHIVPCPMSKFVERGKQVVEMIDALPPEKRFAARSKWRATLARIDLCDMTQCPCPACSGRGWLLRLVQTGPARVEQSP